MTTVEKLTALREQMQVHQCDYYYVPSSDPHQDEYVPEVWQRRAWISGFDGSAGDVLVGLDKAYLWTDGRYVLQAQAQLDASCFELMVPALGAASIPQWLQSHQNGRLAVDPKVISIEQMDRLEDVLLNTGGELVPIDTNLVDAIHDQQHALPQAPVRLWPEQYAGMSALDKIAHLQRSLIDSGCDAMALNVLDQIAWLFNVRGADVAYNPVVISYAIVEPQAVHWFIDEKKISTEVRAHCEASGIQLHGYDEMAAHMAALRGVIVMDPKSASWWMLQQIEQAEIALAPSIIDMMKACKNPVEQAGMVEAHRLDGLALCRFFHWLESHDQQGLTEISASDQLEQCRRQSADCLDLSFPTISGFAEHGAVIHYSATPKSDKAIDDSNLYLVDSGGQYAQGTTDVTRTLHLGQPTAEQKRLYTAVLRGHIALSKLTFPHGTTGAQLDAIARQYIWQQQWDYAHGTGHGVGCHLCVHEGPQSISKTGPASQVTLLPGMVVSNEPGVYWPDHFGIRIENLCLITECEPSMANDFGPFYRLQTLTLAPYAIKLIDLSVLDASERAWLNDYHQRVVNTLSGDLSEADAAWLMGATQPV